MENSRSQHQFTWSNFWEKKNPSKFPELEVAPYICVKYCEVELSFLSAPVVNQEVQEKCISSEKRGIWADGHRKNISQGLQ